MRRVISYITEVLSMVSNASRLYLRAILRNSTQFCIILYNSTQFCIILNNSTQFCIILYNIPTNLIFLMNKSVPEDLGSSCSKHVIWVSSGTRTFQYLDWFLDQKKHNVYAVLRTPWIYNILASWIQGANSLKTQIWTVEKEIINKS